MSSDQKIQTHEDLSVYKKSIDLVEAIYKLTRDYPSDEKFGLISQMRRCAVSVPSNISEGFGRKSKKEIVQFLYISSGSLSELKTQVEISKRLGFVSNSSLIVNIDEIKKMLFGLIKSLKQ
jgi:four helix bundle protein|tara:strand:+ start:301 stop:663 length:363 start_codon:yes stop_codon:yes gene_type:complete